MRPLVIALLLAGFVALARADGDPAARDQLVRALRSDGDPVELIQTLPLVEGDPMIARTLAAWRISGVFLREGTPFLLEEGTDAAIQVIDGKPLRGADGTPLHLRADECTAIDTTSKLRKAIKRYLDVVNLADPNPAVRRDAANKLGFEQNRDYLPFFEKRLAVEKKPDVQRTLRESIAITCLASTNADERVTAATDLGAMPSIAAKDLLTKLSKKPGDPAAVAAGAAVLKIEEHIRFGNALGTVFRGLSLASVLLIAALGLAITFGLMGVINMAHGEMIMVGAYCAYMTQKAFAGWFGNSGPGFDAYLPFALVFAFIVAATVGLILERGIIQFLYRRPLESLLATWGVSLVLQQLFRTIFGAANVQVASPSWVSGSFDWRDILFAYNRLFVMGVAVLTVFGTWFLLAKTKLGLRMRAVMQNRGMAACLGVSTSQIYMITFAFGSGLAGVAGACLSQIGNVGPSLGQSHIVDCFMIVVLGGVGNLVGTVSASLGIGLVDQTLQPFLGAVLGKITVLVSIILFLQWRPAGLFTARTRSLEG